MGYIVRQLKTGLKRPVFLNDVDDSYNFFNSIILKFGRTAIEEVFPNVLWRLVNPEIFY
jgi:hypothetical protein